MANQNPPYFKMLEHLNWQVIMH